MVNLLIKNKSRQNTRGIFGGISPCVRNTNLNAPIAYSYPPPHPVIGTYLQPCYVP
jgi:hypothetical protein